MRPYEREVEVRQGPVWQLPGGSQVLRTVGEADHHAEEDAVGAGGGHAGGGRGPHVRHAAGVRARALYARVRYAEIKSSP